MGMYGEVTAATRSEFDKFSDGDVLGGFFSFTTTVEDTVSLEKAWHGLHFLLTGSAWGGQGPLAFLLADDDQAEEDAPRWFSPEETRQIHEALSGVSDAMLWSNFDADQMEAFDIYPLIWDEPEEDLREEYLMYFNELKQIVAAAAESDRGLMISIG